MPPKPLELTDYQKDEVETLAAVLTSSQIADYFMIGRRTFYDLMARDPEVAARYKKGKAKAIGSIAQGLINKARAGDTVSMIFFLKTQAGWREHGTIDEQLPGEDDEPGLDVSNLSDAILKAIVAAADGPRVGDPRPGDAVQEADTRPALPRISD